MVTTVEIKQKVPSLKSKSKDGKTTGFVWTEMTPSQVMTRVHPQAVAREYFVEKEDDYSSFYLLDKLGNRVNEELYVELTDGEIDQLKVAR